MSDSPRSSIIINDIDISSLRSSWKQEQFLILHIFCIATSNGLIEAKGQTVLTTSGKTHFMSPLGPIQLTAEECNEILMKRAAAAVAANNQQQHTIQSSDGHHSISVQVQKVIQGLEDDNDSQTTTTHLKIEPNLEISPKIEQIEVSIRSQCQCQLTTKQ